MRERFYELAREALDEHERVAVVTAQIGTDSIGDHPRHFDVGIREQLMIGVAAGLALEGYRPVVHSYTPFVVERPWEFLKLDLGHNDLGAVLVSTGASYDAARGGRTHQAPEDVALVAALPGWTIHVPGHPDELELLFRQSLPGDDRVYLRMSEEQNHARVDGGGFRVLRRGSPGAPLVVAVGPTLKPVLEATAARDVSVAYLATVRPFPQGGVRGTLADGTEVVLVEPYQAGTSASEIAVALRDRPHRLLALGVPNAEFRRYGTGAEHRAAHGLDAAGIARSIEEFLGHWNSFRKDHAPTGCDGRVREGRRERE
jgi:transketolase